MICCRQYQRRAPLAGLATALVCLLFALPVTASDACTSDLAGMVRGQQRPMLICGADIPAGYQLTGLESAGIEVTYQQYLKRCSLDDRNPGLYLWLQAGARAGSAELQLTGADGTPVCQPLALAVDDRLLLPDVELEPLPGGDAGDYRLNIVAPDPVDLSAACDRTPAFVADTMAPAMRLLAPPRCDRMRIRMTVQVDGQQRFAGALALEGVRTPGGTVSAMVNVSLPEPDWLDAMPDRKARYIDVAGYRTRYFEAGRGDDALIFVHGGQPDPIAPTAQTWRQNFYGLSREFRVIAYDGLGHGYTDVPKDDDAYANYYRVIADHLSALIDALDLRRVHLVGHSQGGWPVLRVALDRPDVVRCVVSASTVMSLGGEHGRAGTGRFAYSLFYLHPDSGPTVQSILRQQRFESNSWSNISPQWIAADLRNTALPGPREAQAAMAGQRMSPGHPAFRALRAEALQALAAGQLQVPHLVLWSRQDQLAPMAAGLDFFELAGDSSTAPTALQVVDDGGHRFLVEQPEAFNAAVSGFCGQFRES